MHRSLIRFFIPLSVALFWSGCTTETDAPKAAAVPVTTKHVMIFGHPPKQPYEILGTVRDMEVFHGDGENSVTFAINEKGNILDVIREKAAALGADAVILKEEHVVDPDADPGSATNSTHIYLSGVAIRFKPTP